jgi:hypothetical protein
MCIYMCMYRRIHTPISKRHAHRLYDGLAARWSTSKGMLHPAPRQSAADATNHTARTAIHSQASADIKQEKWRHRWQR